MLVRQGLSLRNRRRGCKSESDLSETKKVKVELISEKNACPTDLSETKKSESEAKKVNVEHDPTRGTRWRTRLVTMQMKKRLQK